MDNKGLKTTLSTKNLKYGEYKTKAPQAAFLRKMYEKLYYLTDTREEWEKDKWDARVLNKKYGISYNTSDTHYYIDFTTIHNDVFKQHVKKYIKTRLLGGKKFSLGTAMNYLRFVPRFLNFISQLEPNWSNLNNLTRKHIENYLEYLHYYAKNNLKYKKLIQSNIYLIV